MDQARIFVLLAVVLCMIFSLAALHRFSRSASDSTGTGDSTLFRGTSGQPAALPAESSFTGGSADQVVPMVRPPDFCFGTSSPEETDHSFQELADRIKPQEGGDPQHSPPGSRREGGAQVEPE